MADPRPHTRTAGSRPRAALDERSATSLPLHEERRSWPLSWFLAATGVASILFGGWTVVAWLGARHAYKVTEFRDTHSASWTAAKTGEGIAVVVAVVSLIYLVRGCRRARGPTLDAKVVLGTLPIYWIDPLLNALQPSFFYSSNSSTSPTGAATCRWSGTQSAAASPSLFYSSGPFTRSAATPSPRRSRRSCTGRNSVGRGSATPSLSRSP